MRLAPVALFAAGMAALYFALRNKTELRGSVFDPNPIPRNMADEVVSNIIEPIKAIMSGPRGIRNNNPGNIVRTSDRWQGMSADQSRDPRFVVFDAPVYGIRALARVLRKYNESGLNTVSAIINRWAPPVENDTGAYARVVAAALGVSPTTPITLTDSTMVNLIAAIIKHENGTQPYPGALIAQAVQMERAS